MNTDTATLNFCDSCGAAISNESELCYDAQYGQYLCPTCDQNIGPDSRADTLSSADAQYAWLHTAIISAEHAVHRAQDRVRSLKAQFARLQRERRKLRLPTVRL